ncbi:ornithine cyclodeaminase family protein [Dactylosporangium roseum]|uniref:Ornithine cyclodeaminase family protein n=1 Tax=Dactylosporangium roseum TaxID=47989 RepID=A0ABY5YYR1_9ACTN|nr:ornithine cyclodeaminase family protein [Dactylosporangium roseum]UWZ34531.1 ornithine cyclodeaminase family protein [Dactylosporangium roseum]
MTNLRPRGKPTQAHERHFAGMRLISADEVAAHVPFEAAVDALENALLNGLDPECDPMRSRIETATGEFLMMPSTLGELSGIKVLSSTEANPRRGLPLIQGAYLLFDGPDQRPAAIIDGIALTNLRTPALSALALRFLTPDRKPERLTIFGAGPQARGHALALCALRNVTDVSLVGVDAASVEALAAEITQTGTPARPYILEEAAPAVARADIICTCTSSPTPLFDGALVRDSAVVVAMGSHSPETRETDDTLITRATVVIESRSSVLREAGDIIIPVESGLIDGDVLVTLSDVVTGNAHVDSTRPRLFKFVGMPWQDLVVAAAIYRSITSTPQP